MLFGNLKAVVDLHISTKNQHQFSSQTATSFRPQHFLFMLIIFFCTTGTTQQQDSSGSPLVEQGCTTSPPTSRSHLASELHFMSLSTATRCVVSGMIMMLLQMVTLHRLPVVDWLSLRKVRLCPYRTTTPSHRLPAVDWLSWRKVSESVCVCMRERQKRERKEYCTSW